MGKDTDFLKQRVTAAAQPSQATTTSTNASTVDSVNTFLEDVTADDPNTIRDKNLNAALRMGSKRARLEQQAAKLDAQDQEKLAKQQAKEEQQQAIDAQKEEQQSTIDVSDRASKVVTSVSENVNPLIDKVGSLPTVGGIGLLVLILVILLFTVVVVNDQGDTRLKQLWYMLNGRATIKGRQKVTGATSTPGTTNNITIPGSVNIPGPPGLPGIGINPLNPLVPITINPTGGGGPDLTHASTDLGF